ncbi:type II toxin-antitoxin system HicB family antitoxin [Methanogenium sp. S4BF]|uniref:type II toxin-antitoxin system HicB family antitoxin n=1 Tax=Methanogenium sp. S4BF TaxID=1789226 RepID=UPI0024168336|nr:type II toxin-antitoxin system HicB family antitoxin [Methanogenium sp. S4BF]WFN35024.1 type II toxin-antitoxin system HicB family antitoxin [Methanogenium sp. S4BF]
MNRFLFIIEKTDGTYSAYSPDLPGCAATGATREETEERMRESIELHVLDDELNDNLQHEEFTPWT